MSNRKEIMFALMWIAVTGHIIVLYLIQIGIFSACQHFVGIALVGNIIYDLVFRGFEHIVQRDRCLHHTKIRSEMPAMFTCALQKGMTHFFCQYRKLLHFQFLYIFRSIDFFYIHLLLTLLFIPAQNTGLHGCLIAGHFKFQTFHRLLNLFFLFL